jgi:hypothetical protein
MDACRFETRNHLGLCLSSLYQPRTCTYQGSEKNAVQVLKALQGLVLFVMFSYHTPDGKNPLWGFIGYPGEDESATMLKTGIQRGGKRYTG